MQIGADVELVQYLQKQVNTNPSTEVLYMWIDICGYMNMGYITNECSL